MTDQLAANYLLKVSGTELSADVTRFISQVEYESADGVVDMARITATNPMDKERFISTTSSSSLRRTV